MEAKQPVDLASVLDDLKLGRFHLTVFVLCFAVLFIEGMDFAAALVAAPAILRAWHLEQSAMGLVFGAGNLGLLIGAIAFGKIGDRYGRRPGIIAGVLLYSLPALATAFAGTRDELLVLRFLTCLGIGGVLPNVIALLTESAPKRIRASFVILALIGYALGPAAVGGLASALIPRFGWPAVFFLVGVSGTAFCVLLYCVLPESIRFLAIADPGSERFRRLVKSALPAAVFGSDTSFFIEPESQKTSFFIRQLFRDELRVVTPLLWCAFFAEALTFVTLISWAPVLLEAGGVSPTAASLAFAYGAAGGVFVRMALAKLVDLAGPLATFVAVAITLIGLAYAGSSDLSTTMFMAAVVFAMSFAAGAHDSLNSVVGTFYPTSVRANGVGFASGAGRLAAIFGPVIGGYLLSAHLPLKDTIYVIASPYTLVLFLCLALARSSSREHEARRSKSAAAQGL
jgi:AAHS family 4-hydroxybenzoate transporter-like MFS transporter